MPRGACVAPMCWSRHATPCHGVGVATCRRSVVGVAPCRLSVGWLESSSRAGSPCDCWSRRVVASPVESPTRLRAQAPQR
eukprot:1076194-Prymnesium_polylepis.2